jgi:glycerate-2-kinase
MVGHPIPDNKAVKAANSVIDRLTKAGINLFMMKSGFEITVTNLVRQQLSR